ncbi:ANTAR domain-containing protein [Pseudorhizobium halotolerans]|uniref:ANTAR domain-containing protein n=1 Tax=Pseudorhizobium halotolerans TaxID=1233081 RepID=A0ABN7JY83_9HYPH|nr:ANTAR domain-containing protein [Pseudorhizobium halotolerans]CAD7047563.1 ANTAR domain-containing protein [Pseudorhizobium halotolerans]
MTEDLTERSDNLLRRLRRMRVLVIHPDDGEREMFLAHLRRIGCQVESVWPAPASLPEQVNVVLFVVNRIHDRGALAWMATADNIARVGIISFETPEILQELERLHVHGVLSKPIRLFGVLAVLTTAVSLARHEMRLKKRVASLDETLKARRTIEQAVQILVETRSITEAEAYKRLRERSMDSKQSIATIATAVIAAHAI